MTGLRGEWEEMLPECLQLSGAGVKVNDGAIIKLGESEASLEASRTQSVKFHLAVFEVHFELHRAYIQQKMREKKMCSGKRSGQKTYRLINLCLLLIAPPSEVKQRKCLPFSIR